MDFTRQLPSAITSTEIASFLDFSSLLALKMANRFTYKLVCIAQDKAKQLVANPHVYTSTYVAFQVERYASLIERMNPLQIRCMVESLCFACNKPYRGPITLDLQVYGHCRCISNLLVNACSQKEGSDVPAPVGKLPSSFPAVLSHNRIGSLHPETPGVPVETTCMVFEKRHTKVDPLHTLEGFQNSTLPVAYSPKRVRVRDLTRCPPGPKTRPKARPKARPKSKRLRVRL